MRVHIAQDVFTQFPSYARAVLFIRESDNQESQAQAEKYLRQAEQYAHTLFAQENLTTYPQIANWRQAFKLLGMSQYYSPIEALARRARRGDSVPYINTLVALMNGFSLHHLLPCGGDDVDRISGDLWLRHATGDEIFSILNAGSDQSPDPGEMIYVDDDKMVLCRRWIWRQSEQSKITSDSRNVLVNIDILSPISPSSILELANELALIIQSCTGAHVDCDFMTSERPEVEF